MLATGEYVQGEAIVALYGNEDGALAAQDELPVDGLEPLMEVSAQAAGIATGEGLVAQAEQGVTLSLVSSDSLSTEELLRSLADDPRVAFAEPNYYAELAEDEEAQAIAEASAEYVPQDSDAARDLRQLQWGSWDTTEEGMRYMDTLGNYSINVPGFDTPEVGANMDEVIVVAVLDGAVDFSNPDLADRAYTFSPQLQERLGCDVHGFNASAESTDGKLIVNPTFTTDNHGTHCAGIIGASWDGQGISGVASNAKIVSIQLVGTRTGEENGKTSLGNALRGFDFVRRANDAGVGIRVTSNSYGFYQVSRALNAATYELGQAQGVVSVVAACNDTRDNDISPILPSTYADNPYVITVAALGQGDSLASFSNYGDLTVDLAAPGVSILSTVTPGQSMYIPMATDSDILLEDFESDAPILTVQQIDEEGNLVSEPASISTTAHLMGAHGIEMPIDPEYNIDVGSWFPIYVTGVRFDFDLEAAQAQTGILPEPLQGASAVMHAGKIVVEGATMQTLPSGEPTDEFVGDETAEERVYVYDPSKSEWSQASSEGMYVGQTIVSDSGKLMLVGGLRQMTDPDDPESSYDAPAPAFSYSLTKGALEELFPLYGLISDPQAVVRDGNVYLYNPKNYDFSVVIDGQPSMRRDMLPDIALETSEGLSMIQHREDPVIGWGVLANATEGIIFVGLPAADGSSETYILRDGSQKFEPYDKRASDDRVYSPAACTYRGRLFVIGSAWREPNQRLFRATAMEVDEYPGDIPCEEDPTPVPPAPTPVNPQPVTPSKTDASAVL
ncbi:MAG: S8 family serine peptidase [Atopobiaceae bacterium]|nr:S8 family serine peptidase [Atopobiaceae bacterium]